MFSGIAWREGEIPNFNAAMWRNPEGSHSLFLYCCLFQDVRFHFWIPLKPFRPLWRRIVRAAPACTLWERDWCSDRLVFRPWRRISISGLELNEAWARL